MNKFKHQTACMEMAKRFQDEKLEMIGKYGCCAFVALWIMGIEGDYQNICLLADCMGKSLENDCTVKWYDFFLTCSGRKVKVEFREINDLMELVDVDRCAVRYDYNGKSHWVGVEHGRIAYNSLESSQCVTKGKPVTARIIYY